MGKYHFTIDLLFDWFGLVPPLVFPDPTHSYNLLPYSQMLDEAEKSCQGQKTWLILPKIKTK